MDIVVLFPGQGSQAPGMGQDLASAFPEARAVFDGADRALETKLSELCFSGPADVLTRTDNAQPALLTHGAAVWAVVRGRIAGKVRAAAGHSLGECTAYYAAGALDFADALRLVRRRGTLMAEAGTRHPGTMAALLGDLTEPVEGICERATREAGTVVAANYNAPGQVVVSGEVAGVERAMELAKAAGAKRAVKLNVSGAFHSPLMSEAADGLRGALDAVPFHDSAFPVYSNVTEQPSTSAADGRALLVRQLTAPVRWEGLIRNLAAKVPGALFVEMGPGSVLTGLVRRIIPGAEAMTCGTSGDVAKLLERVA